MFEDFQRIGRLLFQEGLIDAFGGNMSLLKGDKILITKRDVMLGELKKDDLIEVGLEPGDKDAQASRELKTHRAVYKQGKTQAIINAHPANAIAISITDNKVVPQDAVGLFLFKAAPIVRVRDGVGSEETVRLLPNFLNGDNVIAVVKSLGSFAVGQDLAEAYKYTSALENSCKVLVAMRSSGGRSQSSDRRSSAPTGRGQSHARGPMHDRSQRRQPSGRQGRSEHRSAIPPGIGVMGRDRNRNR